ncbi:MAG: pyridoxal 5'-phosphate synthase glutaminase subunit PdxT [Candidatus Thermoplasmatota archaeon]|nr:pyridoxal 5'-phosphate synthase glutaminase subunit PdxT [Candidatus Thermoplasmatota archaeon]
MIVGIVGFQGDVQEHVKSLRRAGRSRKLQVRPIRRPEDIDGISGIVIPGGESTTIYKLLNTYGIYNLIKLECKTGLPVMGTCAGLILISKETGDPRVNGMGILNATVTRNAYGRQKESFMGEISVDSIGKMVVPFIRAPKIINADEDSIIGRYGNEPVILRKGNALGLTFHPELTDDLRIHEMFLDMVEGEGYTSTGE